MSELYIWKGLSGVPAAAADHDAQRVAGVHAAGPGAAAGRPGPAGQAVRERWVPCINTCVYTLLSRRFCAALTSNVLYCAVSLLMHACHRTTALRAFPTIGSTC